MDYRFLEPEDEKLLELASLPTKDGIALAMRTTGFGADEAEVLDLAIVDLDGNELFAQTVKPQNTETWEPSDATGGIAPKDVEEAPELYQFEEEISDLFENASIAVASYLPFAENAIESSWVTLPQFEGFDLVSRFCETHCTNDYPNEPATAASLQGIADYYGITCDSESTKGLAVATAACYRALAAELADAREAKGDEYWRRREERLAKEAEGQQTLSKAARIREKRFNQMNGLLWVAAGLIFISLIIQLYQRGGDIGFMVVCGAFAVFAFIRAVANFRK